MAIDIKLTKGEELTKAEVLREIEENPRFHLALVLLFNSIARKMFNKAVEIDAGIATVKDRGALPDLGRILEMAQVFILGEGSTETGKQYPEIAEYIAEAYINTMENAVERHKKETLDPEARRKFLDMLN